MSEGYNNSLGFCDSYERHFRPIKWLVLFKYYSVLSVYNCYYISCTLLAERNLEYVFDC